MSEIQSQKKQEITQEVIPDIVTEKEQVSKIGIAEAKLYKELYTGPIPHPSIMEKYEKILPGSADRILIMAEKQASHRQEMEKIMFKSQSRDSICGILFAFIISLTTLASGVAVALIQQNSVSLENNDIKRNATEIALKHWYEVLW